MHSEVETYASNSLAAGRVTHTRQVWRMLLDNKRYPGPTG